MSPILGILISVVLGLVGAGAVYTQAAQAPAVYVSRFTAPWFTQASLFLVVVVPPALAFFKVHRLIGMRRVVFFGGIIIWLGALAGIYTAFRWVF